MMFKNKWIKLSIFGIIGMAAGYAFYFYIGCSGGACPITSNPYISTGYGLGAGLLIGWEGSNKKKDK